MWSDFKCSNTHSIHVIIIIIINLVLIFILGIIFLMGIINVASKSAV